MVHTYANGELVTWKRVLLLMASCIAVPVTVAFTMVAKHETVTHNGSVTKETFGVYRDATKEVISSIEKRLSEIHVDLREIRKDVRVIRNRDE